MQLLYTHMLWAKRANLKSTNAADCQGKDEIISEPGWACGTTCQLLIMSSFHLYPCKFALFHTVIVDAHHLEVTPAAIHEHYDVVMCDEVQCQGLSIITS